MLQVQSLDAGRSLITQKTRWYTIAAGVFSLAFGLIMLLHPTGWRSGVQQADPNVIRAIGAAITLFGLLVCLFRTSYRVDPANDRLSREHRIIAVIQASTRKLSELTDLRIRKVANSERGAHYQLVLLGPQTEWILDAGATPAELAASRSAVVDTLGIKDRPVDDEDAEDADEDS